MQASVLDLRRRMPEVLRALDRQERVSVLYRGKERAVLVPTGNPTTQTKKAKNHQAFGMWANRDDLSDVAQHVRTLRKGRSHAL